MHRVNGRGAGQRSSRDRTHAPGKSRGDALGSGRVDRDIIGSLVSSDPGFLQSPILQASGSDQPMRILMIAPEPFFEPRGTPFSEYHRIRALTELGHTVDLVTYPFGQDVALPGLRVFRCLRPPFVRGVRIGPSLAEGPARPRAVALHGAAARAGGAVRRGPLARGGGGHRRACSRRCCGVPHLYDMHSSLPQQLTNFAFSRSRAAARRLRLARARRDPPLARRHRHLPAARARRCAAIDPAAEPVLIENAPGFGRCAGGRAPGARSARELGLAGRRPARRSTPAPSRRTRGSTCCSRRRRIVARARPGRAVRCWPAASPSRSSAARAQARARRRRRRDDLRRASGRPRRFPRSSTPPTCSSRRAARGTNTPLKIYQYLRSGRPIVATRLLTHTQVLDDEVVDPDRARRPRASPAGILRGARRSGARARRWATARAQLAETKYSYEAYLDAHARRRSDASATPAAAAGRREASRDARRAARRPRRPTTTATRSTPIPAMAGALRRSCASAGRSARCSPRRRSGCSPTFLAPIDGPRGARRRHRHRPRRARARAGAARAVTGVDASARDARASRESARASERRRRRRSRVGDAHALAVPGPVVRRRRSACAC